MDERIIDTPTPVDLSRIANRAQVPAVHLLISLGGKQTPGSGVHGVVTWSDGKAYMAPVVITPTSAEYIVKHTGARPTKRLLISINKEHASDLSWPIEYAPEPSPFKDDPLPVLIPEVVSERPAQSKAAHQGPHSGVQVFYDSPVVIEKTWSDGTVDFWCRECGAGPFLSVRSTSAHAGIHTKRRRGTVNTGRRGKAKQEALPPIEETKPTVTGSEIAQRLVDQVTMRADLIKIRDIVAPDYLSLQAEVVRLREQLAARSESSTLKALRDLIDKEITQ